MTKASKKGWHYLRCHANSVGGWRVSCMTEDESSRYKPVLHSSSVTRCHLLFEWQCIEIYDCTLFFWWCRGVIQDKEGVWLRMNEIFVLKKNHCGITENKDDNKKHPEPQNLPKLSDGHIKLLRGRGVRQFFSAKIFSNQKAGHEDLKKQKEGPKTRKCVTQLKTPNSKRTTCSLPVCKLELPGMLTSLIKQWALRSFQ